MELRLLDLVVASLDLLKTLDVNQEVAPHRHTASELSFELATFRQDANVFSTFDPSTPPLHLLFEDRPYHGTPLRFAQHLRRISIHSRRFSAPYAWHLLLLESLSFAPYYFDSFSLYSCNCSFKVAGISSYMISIKSETFCFG